MKLKSIYEIDQRASTALVILQGEQPRGEAFIEHKRVEFPIDPLPTEIKDLCTIYGLRAFLADKTSDAKKNGVDKLEWMENVYNDLLNGQWFTKRSGKKGSEIPPEVIELVMELSGGSFAEVKGQIEAAGKEWLDAFKAKYKDDLVDRRARMNDAKAADGDALNRLL